MDGTAGATVKERGCHLRATRVVHAHEQDFWDGRHNFPFIVAVAQPDALNCHAGGPCGKGPMTGANIVRSLSVVRGESVG